MHKKKLSNPIYKGLISNNMEESHLNNKSEENIKASELLITNKLYASSVHCSYYATFQFLTCKWSQYSKLTFIQIENNSKGSDSHKYLIDEVIGFIKTSELDGVTDTVLKNVKRSNIQKLKGKINDLKSFRKKSDYKDVCIDDQTSEKSLNYSKDIIKKIKNYMP